MFELIERMRLPTVLFAEGGGGRPGDTDYAVVSALDTRAFALWAGLSGVVPRIAIVSGRCFAGNAVLAGCSDLIVATPRHRPRHGRPGDDRGRRPRHLRARGDRAARRSRRANGVVDVAVADEAEAVAETKRLLVYFQGRSAKPGTRPTQAALRERDPRAPPARLRRPQGGRGAGRPGSVTLPARGASRPEMVTALARIEGRPVGRDRQQPDAPRRRDHRRRRRTRPPAACALRRVRASRSSR